MLAKRTNEPGQGEWWFPGGRVHYLETRLDAANRKLKEECGLVADQLVELCSFDVIVKRLDDGNMSHGITTVYIARVSSDATINLDEQNSVIDWRLPSDWLKEELNPFIEQALKTYLTGVK